MQTRQIIEAAINSDPTATPEERKRILNALNDTQKKVTPITTRRACEILGIHPVTLRRYAKQGKLTPIRYNARRIRWNLESVERFASEGVLNG